MKRRTLPLIAIGMITLTACQTSGRIQQASHHSPQTVCLYSTENTEQGLRLAPKENPEFYRLFFERGLTLQGCENGLNGVRNSREGQVAKKLSNDKLCQLATLKDGSNWDYRPKLNPHRLEADDRKLTVEQCRKLTKRG